MTGKHASTVTLRRNPDGSVVQVLAGRKAKPYPMNRRAGKVLEPLTDDDVTRRALSDADNPPLDDMTLERMAMAGYVKAVRARVSVSQTMFAARYGIPIGTLRDWEYGRRRPEAAALGFIKMVDLLPKQAARAAATCRTPEEAYAYLRNAAELVNVGELYERSKEVLEQSAFRPAALLALAEQRKNEEPGVSGKLYLSVKNALAGIASAVTRRATSR